MWQDNSDSGNSPWSSGPGMSWNMQQQAGGQQLPGLQGGRVMPPPLSQQFNRGGHQQWQPQQPPAPASQAQQWGYQHVQAQLAAAAQQAAQQNQQQWHQPQSMQPQHQMWNAGAQMHAGGYDDKKMMPANQRMYPKQQIHQPQPQQQQGGYSLQMPVHHQPHQTHPQQQGAWPGSKVEQANSWESVSTSKDYGQWGAAHPQQQQHHQQHQAQAPQQQQQQWSNEWATGSQARGGGDMNWQNQTAAQMPMQPQPQQPTQTWQTVHTEAPNVHGQPRIDTFNPNATAGSGSVGSWNPNQGAQPEQPASDMFWQDPNPKNKRQQRDTGTSYWGDPLAQQQDIRRWKEADHEEFQRGPQTSNWNQAPGTTGWGDLPESSWRPNVWEAGSLDEPDPLAPVIRQDEAMRAQTAVQTQELLRQIHRAVSGGWLKPEIVNQQLPPERLRLVNCLLQRSYRLEQAENELEHLRINIHRDFSSGMAPTTNVTKQEYNRLACEVEQIRRDMTALASEIQNGGKQPGMGASRLQQWQRRAQNNEANGLDQLAGTLQHLGIHDEKSLPWAQETSLEWANPAPVVNTDLTESKDSQKQSPTTSNNGMIGPQEFIPGKKWEWNDPNKIAEDPNATPASVKPSFASPQQYNNWSNGNDPWKEKPKGDSSEEKPSE